MKKLLTFGVFDYFHYGHLKLFEHAKEHGDYLIVAMQDGDYIKKFKPDANVLYTTQQRYEMLSALRIVDEVIVYQSVAEDIKKIDFDILVLGEDHVGPRFDAMTEYCRETGREVVRLKRTPGISSTDIKANLK